MREYYDCECGPMRDRDLTPIYDCRNNNHKIFQKYYIIGKSGSRYGFISSEESHSIGRIILAEIEEMGSSYRGWLEYVLECMLPGQTVSQMEIDQEINSLIEKKLIEEVIIEGRRPKNRLRLKE